MPNDHRQHRRGPQYLDEMAKLARRAAALAAILRDEDRLATALVAQHIAEGLRDLTSDGLRRVA
jgi:hypothetical protein